MSADDLAASTSRVRAFLDAFGGRRGIDPEEIHSLDGGIDAGGTTLRVSDLRQMLAALDGDTSQ